MVLQSSVSQRPNNDKHRGKTFESEQTTSLWWPVNFRKMAKQAQDEIKDLLAALKDTLSAWNVSSSTSEHSNRPMTKKNSMVECKARFAGQQDEEAVSEFIAALETYKSVEDISDENALKGISLLFTGTASTWWQGIRKEVTTWQDCLRLLREHFAPAKSPYQLYMEIFGAPQDDKTGINLFVIQKRALLAQLPEGRHNEEVEIDLMYGLIHLKYRQFMKRHEIKTFQDLLKNARSIETNDMEASADRAKPKRCSYCNYRGHTTEECRKRLQKQQHPVGEGDKRKET